MMESIAEKIILNLGVRTAERLVPVVGAVIGGTTNYLFIKRMAKSVKEMQGLPVVIQVN
jgi:Rieske Fe-S protein